MKKALLVVLLLFSASYLMAQHHHAEEVDVAYLQSLVKKYKADVRGPYLRLNWYCKDGSINPANKPCGEIGGVQRATYKDEVKELGQKEHIFLGQILSATDREEFWDEEQFHSRLKQYQIERYLRRIDGGWINRRAQYYRGAMQAEDEQEWGKAFFEWVLADDVNLNENFYLLRQALKDIPHTGDDNLAQTMRSQSKVLAASYPAFMELRIKIHGQPEGSDIPKVRQFEARHKDKMDEKELKLIRDLQVTMEEYFAPVDLKSLGIHLATVNQAEIKRKLQAYINENAGMGDIALTLAATADAMWYIREHILEEGSGKGRLALMAFSLELEEIIMTQEGAHEVNTLKKLMEKVAYLAEASAAAGYTEKWEWATLREDMERGAGTDPTLAQLNTFLVAARKQLEWGTGYNRAIYADALDLFEAFEPLAHGYPDDCIRGSVALPLGNAIGKLGNFITDVSGLSNSVLDLNNQSHFHGLNPGYAKGKLIIVEGNAEGMEIDPGSIYVFQRPPSDLKPVAGILTVSEGNLVSHVQLLARNLGIPNAALSASNVEELKKYQGREVFYAVSNKGTVLMKAASRMSSEERALFKEVIKDEDMITIPVEEIRLDRTTVMNMREVNAKSSGIYCGPKAANLGQLKALFPERVVEGLVIPFGIFLNHMKQPIPGKDLSYWEYLNAIFQNSRNMESAGQSAEQVQTYVLAELANLRQFILDMPLMESFERDMETSFQKIFRSPLGRTSVFLRSDTNMEDLKSFTGAGLNLTVFNVREKKRIFEGIKKVWASPYTERSFKWRQSYLTNPENVYPSILVIPSVNNDCSGVMITKGVSSGRTDQITVAFSRGVGGAVDGQAAETWVLSNKAAILSSPAREPYFTYLPPSGTKQSTAAFVSPILSDQNLKQLWELSGQLQRKMMENDITGPYDVELGFKEGKIYLFQVRPFVENKNATGSEYLRSISPEVDSAQKIRLESGI